MKPETRNHNHSRSTSQEENFHSFLRWQQAQCKPRRSISSIDFYHTLISNSPLRKSLGLTLGISTVALATILVYISAYLAYALCLLAPDVGFVPLVVFPFVPYLAYFETFYAVAVGSPPVLRYAAILLVYSLFNHTAGMIIAVLAAHADLSLVLTSFGLLVGTLLCAVVVRMYSAFVAWKRDLEAIHAAAEEIGAEEAGEDRFEVNVGKSKLRFHRGSE
eukprot:608153-Amorphochlora_amoeboformis.AAC.1